MENSWVIVNGNLTPATDAKISPFDRGFLFGDGVFEVFVAFDSKILDLKEHLDRLRESARNIHLEIPFSNEDIIFELDTICEHVKSKKKYIRLMITRGDGIGLSTHTNMKPNRIVMGMPATKQLPELYEKGLDLKLVPLPLTERGPAAKTGNYLRSIIALEEIKGSGFHDVLWYNLEEEITECSTANIFFIGRTGDSVEIATPHLSSGLLPGITRHMMIRLLEHAQIPVTVRVIDRNEIPRFDEAFATSTVRGLIPINKIDSHKLHTMRKESTFRHFNRLYLSYVSSELGYKVDWNV